MIQSEGAPSAAPSSVRVGGLGPLDLLQQLRHQNVQLNQAAELLFEDSRFAVLPDERTVEIEVISVADLGFHDGATFAQLTARAAESGLSECPLELGPHLRLQYRDQPEAPIEPTPSRGTAPSGSLTVASQPLDDSEDTPKGFYLRHADGVLWLRGYWAPTSHVWNPGDVIVFARDSSPIKP